MNMQMHKNESNEKILLQNVCYNIINAGIEFYADIYSHNLRVASKELRIEVGLRREDRETKANK